MRYTLTQPCVGCPFTPEAVPPPGVHELDDMFIGTTTRAYSMTCHRTKGRGEREEFCAGARRIRQRSGIDDPPMHEARR